MKNPFWYLGFVWGRISWCWWQLTVGWYSTVVYPWRAGKRAGDLMED